MSLDTPPQHPARYVAIPDTPLDSAEAMEERLRLPGLQPHRADIVVHGICILLSAMERLGWEQVTVSEYGNLEGYLKMKYLP